jgi:multifunctional 2-oxoglutarate metabolism enzyme
MHERYLSDPTSVPAEWVAYFQKNPQNVAAGAAASTTAAPTAGVPPTPKPVTPPNISINTARTVEPAANPLRL